MLVDSHCHLDRIDLEPYQGDLGLAIAAAKERGVSRMLCVGIDLNNAQTVVDIAHAYEGIYASVGLHPLDIDDSEKDYSLLQHLASDPSVVAVGETGLDYYYSKDSAELQRESFRRHLQLAKSVSKPVIVHTRDAREDTLTIIREQGDLDLGGVLHCFTENWEMAQQAIDLNYYISFSGIVTFNNAKALREVVKQVPLERLLVETDAPYLAPVPYRGKKNEPKYVVEVAQCIAELKGVSYEKILQCTSENFSNLFL